MRLPALALILTIFILPGPMLPVNANPTALHIHAPPSSSNGTSSSTSTAPTTTSSSSSSTIPASSSSSISTSFTTSPTPTSTSSSFSSGTPSFSSSFSTSSSPSTSAQTSSSSQATSSSTQLTPVALSSTSSSVTSDTTNTSPTSQTQTRTTFTSTRSDGALITVTAVVSSPSGGSGSGIISTARQGFFANTGAVAGTFLVVGLIGTGIFICVFLWGLRRYRRRKRYLAYFDAEDKEFNEPRERGGTPEATLPDVTRDSPLATPVSSSPTPNMIERLHGNEAVIPNVSYDSSLYQAQPGEFDPYQNHDGAYAYSDDQVYGQYPGNIQPGNIPYAYQPGTEFHSNTDVHQAVAEASHAP